MAKSELRVWAIKGAEQRLVELAEEAGGIFSAFPELRGRGPLFDVAAQRQTRAAGSTDGEAKPARKRRKRSAAARKRMSDAQKARWAKRKAAQSQASVEGGREPVTKPSGSGRARKRK